MLRRVKTFIALVYLQLYVTTLTFAQGKRVDINLNVKKTCLQATGISNHGFGL